MESVKENKPLQEIIGDVLLANNSESIQKIDFKTINAEFSTSGRFVCFYFGAHWAPPSRLFTTNLAKFYTDVNINQKCVEVVFISDDRTQPYFEKNFLKMPWKAIPFEESERIMNLKSRYGVCDIPTLVVISPDGKVLEHDACQ